MALLRTSHATDAADAMDAARGPRWRWRDLLQTDNDGVLVVYCNSPPSVTARAGAAAEGEQVVHSAAAAS